MKDTKNLLYQMYWKRLAGDTLLVLASMTALTLLMLLLHLAARTSDSLLLYLLAIFIFACVRGLYPALLASFVAFFTFDYFFVPPLYGLATAKFEDIFSLVVFLLVAIITGQLASLLRIHAVRARRREYEARTLYEFMRATNRKSEMEQQMRVFLQALTDVFAAAGILDCMLLLPDERGTLHPLGDSGGPLASMPLLFDEVAVAEWVMDHARAADLYPQCQPALAAQNAKTAWQKPGKLFLIRLLPLQAEKQVGGVLRLLIEEDARHLWPGNTLGLSQHAPTSQNTFFSTFLEQAVTTLEQVRLREDSIHLEVLQQTEAQRSALFSSVSHDLRTPLATIRAAASMFLRDKSKDERASREMLARTIEHEVKRLDSWIENVLDMSRLEAGALRLEKVWYPLDELVQDTVSRVQFSLREHAHEISVICPDDLPPAEFDPVQIEQVMMNLLENALRYAPEHSPIEVCIEQQESALLVSVTDRGPGIPPGERERIFEKFYRLTDAPEVEKRPQGLGLGLAICRGSIEAHGGKIWVEERAGGGACFCFTLPLTVLKAEEMDG